VFVCPSCGARQNQTLSPGVVQTRCEYCGNMILIPQQLTGPTRRCSNHPESLSMGICHRCREPFCEQCLRVWTSVASGNKKYLCPKCSEERVRSNRMTVRYTIPAGIILFSIGLLLELFPSIWMYPYPGLDPGTGLYILEFGLFCLCGGAVCREEYKQTRTMQMELAATEGTHAQCPHCHARYFYSSLRIGPDRRVNCQNCNRLFEIQIVSDTGS
jgi:predicted Zn finger-like uncharacterized protein